MMLQFRATCISVGRTGRRAQREREREGERGRGRERERERERSQGSSQTYLWSGLDLKE